MRGLCGWFSDRPDGDARATLQRMLQAPPETPVGAELSPQPQAGIAVYGAAAKPRLLESDGFVLAVCGHPQVAGGAARSSDMALLEALRQRGRDALPGIAGDFALAAWDGRRGHGLLAVDRMGVHRLMYGRTGNALVFGSTLDLVTGYPGMRRELTPQGLFDYLYYHVSPGPQTVFAGLMRVPPGHCVEFGPGRPAGASPYWTMQFEERAGRPLAELEREFLSLTEASVRDAAEGAAAGAFLSGGTDSSTVSGMLGRASGAPARTFSIGFDVQGYDEMSYARIAAKHFGCEQHEYYVTPQDVVDAVPRIAAAYDQPFGNASAIPTYYCAKFAREHGVTRLLAGDGGDELFGGNERYAKYYLLGLYERVPAALRRGVLEPLLLGVPGTQRVPLVRKLRSYIEQARPPMPQRYSSYNLLMYLGQENIFTPEFLTSVDTRHPEALLADAHAPYAGASLINQMLGIDLRFILADGDLPKVTHMCDLAGVDVAFPLLDQRIIDFSSRLPSDLKLRRTQLRWFFKHALRDFLPQEIITKQKHGFGLPVGAWLIGHRPLFDLAVDAIGPLRQRGIVRAQFIDELLDRRLREHPAYFGTMVWILMMLGIWLESRRL